MSNPVDRAEVDDETRAPRAADRLTDRRREKVIEGLKPDGPSDPQGAFDPEDPHAVPRERNEKRAFGQHFEVLGAAPETDQGRAALDGPPMRTTKDRPGSAGDSDA